MFTKLRFGLIAAALAVGITGIAATTETAKAQIYFGVGNPGYNQGYYGNGYGYNRNYGYAPRYGYQPRYGYDQPHYGYGYRSARICRVTHRVYSPRLGRYVYSRFPQRVCSVR